MGQKERDKLKEELKGKKHSYLIGDDFKSI
ncbi:MAG: hypothetical protein ACI93S_001053 [Ancylomarina sp.]|jgi:hypothetical protein